MKSHFKNEKEAILEVEKIIDDPYIDNWRIGYFDDQESMETYEAIRQNGCCGSFDQNVIIGTRLAIIGCNYGH